MLIEQVILPETPNARQSPARKHRQPFAGLRGLIIFTEPRLLFAPRWPVPARNGLSQDEIMTASTVPRAVLGALLWTAVAGRGAIAQAPPSDPEAGSSCGGAVITHVFVDNHSIFETPPVDSAGEIGRMQRFANWVVNRVHWKTRSGFIEDEVLFRAGDCFDPLLLDESERILRALPFIDEAHVYSVPVGDDEVHVVVDTRDDWSLKLDVRPEWDDGLRITHVSATEENFLGMGTLLGLYLTNRDEQRDVGAQFRTERLAGTRLDGRFSGGRTRTGVFFTESLAYPFVGEVGQWAFIESFALREDLFRYAGPADAAFTNASLPIETRYGELTLGRRLGTPGDLTVLGGGLSWEDVRFDRFPGEVEVVSGFDFSERIAADSATVETIRPQVSPRKGAYLNILAGKRNIRFMTRRGLDAIRGEQDIRVGSQVLVALGTSLSKRESSLGNDGHDLRARLGWFVGAAGRSWVFNTEVAIEGTRFRPDGAGGGDYQDILGEFETYLYWHPGETPRPAEEIPRHTFVIGVSGAGGWNNTLPFQLTLGGPFGVRGYDREDFPAAHRVVIHVEDRIVLDGPFRDVFDLGITLFADAGAGWRGDVPFGSDSGLRTSLGAGLRMAFPSGARNVVRLDLAVPVEEGGFRHPQFRVGYDAVSLLTAFGSRQVRRSRAAGPASAFLGSR